MSENHRDPKPPTNQDLLIALRWPLALVVVAVVLSLAGYLIYSTTLREARQAAGAAGELAGAAARRAEEIARAFWTGDVTERFISSLPEIASGGGRLELATLEATETFSRTDERRAFWDLFYIGTTVTEIRVPVTYRYHLRLQDPWRVEVRGGLCLVYAPEIHPTRPPAIHTHRMEKHLESGWLRFDDEEQMIELEKSITPRLSLMAADPRRIDLVREESRRSVENFVKSWLLREEQWGEEGIFAVRVIFPDEVETEPELLDPEVVLEDGVLEEGAFEEP